ncbi:STAS domain-containing protein [Pararhizobium mangrovi]|uniref:STAS domain-containing protein n=1 Tax=Pararhizobium mangrovi TaxID=2590452 RepID=A0A506U3R6_9HYPH|nr:STAS domain-containing protein [Pararhizobium mangrovi]TPW29033.1 STAS domain-containing protein [Pararhizobium mangrovi]
MAEIAAEPAGKPVSTCELPSDLGLAAAGPLTRELAGLRGRDVVVDGSAVRKVSTPCLQVLMSAALTWKLDGAELSLNAPSEALASGVALLGLSIDDFTAAGDAR